MANLPDIDTADVGIIAFWNAHDHLANGADTIDPTDCTGIFTSYSVHDNGIDGYVDTNAKGWGGFGRHINLRVKNDGWVIAWIDRSNSFGKPTYYAADFGETGYKGYYDILWDWVDKVTPFVVISSSYTTLSNMIYRFYDSLTNRASFSFAVTDVGHYCYEFINANVMTMLDSNCQSLDDYHIYTYVQYTAGTTLYYAAMAASGLYAAGYIQFDGNTVLSLASSSAFTYASADLLAENWMPNSLTDYEIDRYGHGLATSYEHPSTLILWS